MTAAGVAESDPISLTEYRNKIDAHDVSLLAEIESMHFSWLNGKPLVDVAAEAAVGVVGGAEPVLRTEGVLEGDVTVGEADAVRQAHAARREAERPLAGVDGGRAAARTHQQIGGFGGEARRRRRRRSPVYEQPGQSDEAGQAGDSEEAPETPTSRP